MDYEEFIKYFTHEISYNLKLLGVTWRASPFIGEEPEGAMVVIRGGGHVDLPPISIYEYYQRFLQGAPWGVAAREATQEFFDDRMTRCALEDMRVFSPDMVIPTFANVKENADWLEQIPHSMFENLAIVLQVVYQSLGGINLNLIVTDDILEEWELSFDELYQKSLDNPRNIESVQMVELYKLLDETGFRLERPVRDTAGQGQDYPPDSVGAAPGDTGLAPGAWISVCGGFHQQRDRLYEKPDPE